MEGGFFLRVLNFWTVFLRFFFMGLLVVVRVLDVRLLRR